MVLEKKILKFRQCIFTKPRLFFLKKDLAIHLNKIEFPYTRMLCAELGLNSHSGSGKEEEKANR